MIYFFLIAVLVELVSFGLSWIIVYGLGWYLVNDAHAAFMVYMFGFMIIFGLLASLFVWAAQKQGLGNESPNPQ